MNGKGLIRFRKDLMLYKHIGVDTMCFIYHFADVPRFSPLTDELFTLTQTEKVSIVTSIVSVIETLVLPEQSEDPELAREYERLFRSLLGLTIIPIDWSVAKLTAKIRAKYPAVRLPDAIQLSAALLAGCKAFVTNDEQFKRVKEIPVILLKDYL